MGPKTERFEMRLDQVTLDRVDTWRRENRDFPSRAEAIRQLINIGLASDHTRRPRFSDGEILTISMLCDVMKHFSIKSGINPLLVESAVVGGHYWAFDWEYPGLFHSDVDSLQTVKEVVSILDMWRFIESGYDKLSNEDKDKIEQAIGPLGKDPCFIGFDGNNESEHYGVAKFLINDLGRFSSFKDRELNSHGPTVFKYRRMVAAFEPMRAGLRDGELGFEKIIHLLKVEKS